MSNFEILDLSKKDLWEEYYSKLHVDLQDIYFTPDYFKLYEKLGNGIPQCAVFEQDGEIAIYPFLLNSINELGLNLNKQFFDIQGVYGYNGILTNCNTERFIQNFFRFFDQYCLQKGVIVEFIRINPLLQNIFIHRSDFNQIFNQNNIAVNLLNENIFETEYEYSTRKNIKKAINNGLIFKSFLGNNINDDDIAVFCDIYYNTMKRNNADEFYYFDEYYFKNISIYLGKKALFSFVYLDNFVISCELILLGGEIAYSFLGGTNNEFYQYRPNDFLKHKTINLLKIMGFKYYLLGGGSEGIFKYKKSFSKNGIYPFYIGYKIHNKKIYDDVVRQWTELYPEKFDKYSPYILKYRY